MARLPLLKFRYLPLFLALGVVSTLIFWLLGEDWDLAQAGRSLSLRSGPLFSEFFAASLVLAVVFLVMGFRRHRETVTTTPPVCQAWQLTPERMVQMLEFNHDVLWLMDLEGGSIYTSPAVLRLRGYTPEEVAALSLEQTFAGPSLALAREILRKARENVPDPTPVYRLEMCHKDGSTVWVEVSASVLCGADGQPDCILGISRDIGDRKQAEDRLMEREALFHSIFRNSPCGISISRYEDGRLIDANPAWLAMFGLSREEALGQTSWELNFWADPAQREEVIGQLVRQGSIHNAEILFRPRSGPLFDGLASAESVDVGGARYLVGVINDISEHKREDAQRLMAQQQRAVLAEARDQAKTRILAIASHDLRQPVQAARLFLGLLRSSELNDQQAQLCGQVDTAVESLVSLLDCLLDITRIDAGGITAQMTETDMAVILAALDGEFSPQAQVRGLRLRLFCPAPAPRLHTDPRLLTAILRNLVGNALKYTRRGGLLLGVRQRDGHLLLQVWDTGIGIPPEHMVRIFEEFYQAGNPHQDKAHGLGLGLSICQRLAPLLGATIDCRSRPGRGSVFELRLPLNP
ncbi:PAS domain-containing sensor histidine kinase [Denitratisoma oestradiolicum]|uniref:histidine kinase n=1 Tax=Denitratisoma oestradiolicum TaxID=311182 RepID=A0A6S6YTR6_9PROT|nr:PAS domain-containing sensor histidine kinase [Denitratisoma oestradiolicum]CAB1370862.1 putative Histidine kinase [Denitratisoma oestradiolicum]